MAYNPYTSQQINDFIGQKGIADDPWAIHNFAQQYGVDPSAIDTARGWGAGTSQGWRDQNVKAGGPHNWQTAQTNPHQAYALAQANNWSSEQADKAYGNMAPGTSQGWAQQQGLTGFGGGPAQSTAGQDAFGLNTGSKPFVGPTQQGGGGGGGGGGAPPNPYLPAGGPGSNGANDPRRGGPPAWSTGVGAGMGQQEPLMPGGGMGGLARYLSDNPHMLAMGNELARNVNNNLNRNVLTGIRGNAMAGGTVGGSRQGVAEGLATGEAMSGLAGALANLYGGQFNQDRGYGLQSDALDLNVYNSNQDWMRKGQQDQMGFMGQMLDWNKQGLGAATQAHNTPLTQWQQISNTGQGLGGMGSQNTQNLQGNPYLVALGGYMAGQKFFGG